MQELSFRFSESMSIGNLLKFSLSQLVTFFNTLFRTLSFAWEKAYAGPRLPVGFVVRIHIIFDLAHVKVDLLNTLAGKLPDLSVQNTLLLILHILHRSQPHGVRLVQLHFTAHRTLEGFLLHHAGSPVLALGEPACKFLHNAIFHIPGRIPPPGSRPSRTRYRLFSSGMVKSFYSGTFYHTTFGIHCLKWRKVPAAKGRKRC